MPTPSARSKTGKDDRSAAWSTETPGCRSAAASLPQQPCESMARSSRQPPHHEKDQRQHEWERAYDRGHGHVDLVEPQVADTERREDVGEIGGTAARQQID